MSRLKNTETGQVTLLHLLWAIAFIMPTVAMTSELRHSAGGILQYLVGVPSSLAVGGLIVWLDWKLGRRLWLGSQRYSRSTQDVVAFGLFVLSLAWVIAGAVTGALLASIVATHVPR